MKVMPKIFWILKFVNEVCFGFYEKIILQKLRKRNNFGIKKLYFNKLLEKIGWSWSRENENRFVKGIM